MDKLDRKLLIEQICAEDKTITSTLRDTWYTMLLSQKQAIFVIKGGQNERIKETN